MQLMLIHSDGFSYGSKRKAIDIAEDWGEDKSFSTPDSCLVVFSAVEKVDEDTPEEVVRKGSQVIKAAADELKEDYIILYPWVHLAERPSSPRSALKVIKDLEKELTANFKVTRAPFGYYKAFTLHCKGHPLAERSMRITVQEGEVSVDKITEEDITALQAEEEARSSFWILDLDGSVVPHNEYNFVDYENLRIFVAYETEKDRTAKEPPIHVELMKKLELVDYEPGSDPGNFRFPPKGFLVKRLIEQHVLDDVVDYGALVVQTPLIYSYEHPSLKSYLERFPARQYIVKSGHDTYFMRFSACFGQFLMKSESQISYRNLPLKMYELTPSYRRELHGELAGIRRLRAFTMPDMHTLAIDMDQARVAFEEQWDRSLQMMKDFELDVETAFRIQKDFWEQNKDWILKMIRKAGKPILLELFDQRYAYFILKFEFNFCDSQEKAAALSTVQIDVENAERFKINYMDENGETKLPVLLHCSLSGSTERCIYAILENAHFKQKAGIPPELPLWLTPGQVRIIPVKENHIPFAQKVADELVQNSIRTEIDDRHLTVAKRVRAAEKLWIPLILVVGDKEQASMNFSVRIRSSKEEIQMSIQELMDYISQRTERKPKMKLPLPISVSRQPIFSRGV